MYTTIVSGAAGEVNSKAVTNGEKKASPKRAGEGKQKDGAGAETPPGVCARSLFKREPSEAGPV